VAEPEGTFVSVDVARLEASSIIAAIKRAHIRTIVALPDRHTSQALLRGLLDDPEMRVVQVCKEDEGVSICSGLYATGHRALLLMQYTGLLDSINAIRGVAVELRNPVCMMVGMLGLEPGTQPVRSNRYGLRIVEPVLDAMAVPHHFLESSGDTDRIEPAIEEAYARPGPVVMLVGTEPV
jgi:sulfopyruvate decarboxylase subunit beta